MLKVACIAAIFAVGASRPQDSIAGFRRLGDIGDRDELGESGEFGNLGDLSDLGNFGYPGKHGGLGKLSGIGDPGNFGGQQDFNKGTKVRAHDHPSKFGSPSKPSSHGGHSDISYQFPYSSQSIKLHTDDEDEDDDHHHISDEQHHHLDVYHPIDDHYEEHDGHRIEAPKVHENSMETPMVHHKKYHNDIPKKHEEHHKKHEKHHGKHEEKHEKHHKSYNHPKYEYDYSVQDPHTGDYKTHHEARTGDMVHGFYTIHEADGTTRIVEYSADQHDGFKATVRHEGQHTTHTA